MSKQTQKKKTASATSLVGSLGEGIVKTMFERMGWGPIRLDEHDTGTDLFVQVRDRNLIELGLLLGVQVKTEKRYFEPRLRRKAEATGHWEYRANQADAEYWIDHTLPHILVLVNIESEDAYWGLINRDSTRWTDKGAYVSVPISQKLDTRSSDALLSLVAESRHAPSWAGSSWDDISTIPPRSRLRLALLAPRIAAPHVNRHVERLEAEEAISHILLGRLHDDDFIQGLPTEEERRSGSFAWQLFDQLEAYITRGDADGIHLLRNSARSDGDKVALCAIRAAVLLEAGNYREALAVIEGTQRDIMEDPIDYAWLNAQRSRCLLELGKIDESCSLALDVAAVGLLHSNDPAAVALRAAALNSTFLANDESIRRAQETIIANDSPPVWWRAEQRARSFTDLLNDAFKTWAGNPPSGDKGHIPTWGQLRSLTLVTGIVGDQRSWRFAASTLAKYELYSGMAKHSADIAGSLNDLRLCGDKDGLRAATRRLVLDGPTEAARIAARNLYLTSCSRTSLDSSIEFVKSTVDLMDTDLADRHGQWLLDTLGSLDKLPLSLQSPVSFVSDGLIPALKLLYGQLSPAMQTGVRTHLFHLPTTPDQSIAEAYASLLKEIGRDGWSPDQLQGIERRVLASKSSEDTDVASRVHDHPSLITAYRVLLANSGYYDQREQLYADLMNGSWDVLVYLGPLEEIPTTVLAVLVPHLVDDIKERAEEACRGFYRGGGVHSGITLLLINVTHPAIANWEAIEWLLRARANYFDQAKIADKLVDLAELIPPSIVSRLLPFIQNLVDLRPSLPRRLSFDMQEKMLRTLIFLKSPIGNMSDLRRALGAGSEGKRAVALAIGREGEDEHAPLLMALSTDQDAAVRAATATASMTWIQRGKAPACVCEGLHDLLRQDGYRNAYAAAAAIDQNPTNEAAAAVVRELCTHGSAGVRRRADRFSALPAD